MAFEKDRKKIKAPNHLAGTQAVSGQPATERTANHSADTQPKVQYYKAFEKVRKIKSMAATIFAVLSLGKNIKQEGRQYRFRRSDTFLRIRDKITQPFSKVYSVKKRATQPPFWTTLQ